jgi:hypothetical protein
MSEDNRAPRGYQENERAAGTGGPSGGERLGSGKPAAVEVAITAGEREPRSREARIRDACLCGTTVPQLPALPGGLDARLQQLVGALAAAHRIEPMQALLGCCACALSAPRGGVAVRGADGARPAHLHIVEVTPGAGLPALVAALAGFVQAGRDEAVEQESAAAQMEAERAMMAIFQRVRPAGPIAIRAVPKARPGRPRAGAPGMLAYEPDGRQIGRMLAAVADRGSILVVGPGAPSLGIPADAGQATPLIGIIESAVAGRPLAADGRAVPAALSTIGRTSRDKVLERAMADAPFPVGAIVLAGGRDAALGEIDPVIAQALRRAGGLPGLVLEMDPDEGADEDARAADAAVADLLACRCEATHAEAVLAYARSHEPLVRAIGSALAVLDYGLGRADAPPARIVSRHVREARALARVLVAHGLGLMRPALFPADVRLAAELYAELVRRGGRAMADDVARILAGRGRFAEAIASRGLVSAGLAKRCGDHLVLCEPAGGIPRKS